MPSQPLRIHGYTHSPWGQDPSPLPYLALSADSATPFASSSVLTTLNLDPAGSDPSVSFGTNAANAFAIEDTGGGDYGLALLQNGLFLLFLSAGFRVSGTPAANSVGSLGLTGSNFPVSGAEDALWFPNLAGAQQASPGIATWLNWPSAYATPPIYQNIKIGQNSGLSSEGYTLDLLIIAIDGIGNTNF